jgi:hypothetical protein
MTRIWNALTLKFILSGIVLAAGVSAAHAAPVGPVTTFTAGTPAKASDVNGNFTTIVTTVNANDTRLTTVETNKQNIVTGACPAGSAIRAIAANGTVTCQNSGGNVGFASVHSAAGVPLNIPGTTTAVCVIFCNAFGRFQTGGSNDFLAMPVSLPQGATITALSFSCFCNNAAGSSVLLLRDDSIIASASISTVSTTIQTASTTTITANTTVVDNQNFGYVILMSMNTAAGGNITPTHATVTYTMP